MKIPKGKGLVALAVIAAAAMMTLAAAGSAAVRGASGSSGSKASTTLIYAGASDPTFLDPALVSDGESFRISKQIFEGLVDLKPGSTSVQPSLATSWSISKNGKTWTFNLRHGVKFSDGTAFNAKAVCYNFNRWFDFPSPLQNAGVSYYWNTVFGGFAHPGAGNPGPGKSLYKSCSTTGTYRAKINLTRRSSSFVGALALTNFGIASPTALKKYNANAG